MGPLFFCDFLAIMARKGNKIKQKLNSLFLVFGMPKILSGKELFCITSIS
jgi:hypothetical protein